VRNYSFSIVAIGRSWRGWRTK